MELKNSINQLAIYTRRLMIWSKLLEKHTNEENAYIVNEFVEPLATVALNLPYAIRQRFIFSVSHLSHQANRAKFSDWKDNLENDQSIDYKTMDKVAKNWNLYSDFRSSVNSISNSEFSDQVYGFRNKYHHRYPPRIEFGLTNLVNRSRILGKVEYNFGCIKPLKLSKLVPILETQHQITYTTFRKYQNLINEQISFIFNA